MLDEYDMATERSDRLLARMRSVEHVKLTHSVEELEHVLSGILLDFCREAGFPLLVSVKFADVHAIIGYKAHTELAYVKVNRLACELIFHPRIIEHRTWEAGFVFVYKCWILLCVLMRALEKEHDLNVGFLFEAGDNGEFESVSFCSSNPNSCLIADHDFVKSGGYRRFREVADASALEWSERQACAFWRGSTTGRRIGPVPTSDNTQDWTWLQRLLLCSQARTIAMSKLCDVGITKIVQIEEDHLKRAIDKSAFVKDAVPRAQFLKYRYVFDIDGNSNAWSGLFCSLYGGSCVIKVASFYGYRQWYYANMKPWREFLPVSKDCSDLNDIISWAFANSAHAELIAMQGERLAKSISLKSALVNSAAALLDWLDR